MKNIMTVDLEDYFCDLEFNQWENYESKILNTTKPILELFRVNKITATFFTVGYIADKFPELIEDIVRDGHEIASHGYAHLDIRKVTKEEFEIDLTKSLQVLERVSKDKIYGFRAPFFSVDMKSIWAMNIIRKYFKYDSSIFPTKTPLYGIPNANRWIYKPSVSNPLIADQNSNFIEMPPATLKIPMLRNVPIAGGFHFRFWPLSITKYGFERLNKKQRPGIFYIHPKDLDKNMPRIKQYSWYYYYGLKNSLKKFENFLKSFQFVSIREFLEQEKFF